MLKQHQALAETLASAEKQAVEIAKAGGNTQGIIHLVRQAKTLTDLRIQSYKDSAADAKAKAELEAKQAIAAAAQKALDGKKDEELVAISKKLKIENPPADRAALIGLLVAAGYKE